MNINEKAFQRIWDETRDGSLPEDLSIELPMDELLTVARGVVAAYQRKKPLIAREHEFISLPGKEMLPSQGGIRLVGGSGKWCLYLEQQARHRWLARFGCMADHCQQYVGRYVEIHVAGMVYQLGDIDDAGGVENVIPCHDVDVIAVHIGPRYSAAVSKDKVEVASDELMEA